MYDAPPPTPPPLIQELNPFLAPLPKRETEPETYYQFPITALNNFPMAELTPPASAPLTFEQAIDLTQTLLDQMERNTLSETELQASLTYLVRTENGARGFFVNYLPDPRPFADRPSDALVQALRTSPEIVSDLMVKNLAMSTAMAIHHRRNQAEEMAQGSDLVQSRSLSLIQLLQLPEMSQKLQQLQETLQTGTGTYEAFLDRWGYDAEQREAIETIVNQALAN